MAALDLQEQEQVDVLKAWWKENGNKLLWVLLISAVAMGGWRGWQYYHNKQSSEAATLYAGFVQQLKSNDTKRINDAAAALIDKYASSGYAPRAALQAAQMNEQGKDASRAKIQLQWVIDHADEAGLKDVARLRLAAVLLDEKNYVEAMKLVEAGHSTAFDGLYSDLRGDILNSQGKSAEAKSAYKLAYEKVDPQSAYRSLIQLKMDAIGDVK